MDGASREATRHARVLLVDDNSDIRDFIELRIFRDREEAGLTEPCVVFLTAKAMETDRELGSRLAQTSTSSSRSTRSRPRTRLTPPSLAPRSAAGGSPIAARTRSDPKRVRRACEKGSNASTVDGSEEGAFYRLGSERGSPNHGSTLVSKRVTERIRSPVRVRTRRPVPCRMPVEARR